MKAPRVGALSLSSVAHSGSRFRLRFRFEEFTVEKLLKVVFINLQHSDFILLPTARSSATSAIISAAVLSDDPASDFAVAFLEIKTGWEDTGAAPGKNTAWSDPAQLKPETVTKEEVAARGHRKKLLGMIPIPGTNTTAAGVSSSK